MQPPIPSVLALQGLSDFLGNPATSWLIIPMMIFTIPIISTLMGPLNARIKAGEREKLRKMYERLALEKLDVIRTAITMGYQQSDLRELDARLEDVIGSDAMRALLDGKSSSGGGKAPKVQVSIGGGKADGEGRTVNLDELISSELSAGLSKRRDERKRSRDDD